VNKGIPYSRTLHFCAAGWGVDTEHCANELERLLEGEECEAEIPGHCKKIDSGHGKMSTQIVWPGLIMQIHAERIIGSASRTSRITTIGELGMETACTGIASMRTGTHVQ